MDIGWSLEVDLGWCPEVGGYRVGLRVFKHHTSLTVNILAASSFNLLIVM